MKDKEYLEREALIESFGTIPPWTGYCEEYTFEESFLIRTILKIIKEHILKQPAADVAEVVRCKDCNCFELMMSNNQHFCNKYGSCVTEKDYCSRPEPKNRKED